MARWEMVQGVTVEADEGLRIRETDLDPVVETFTFKKISLNRSILFTYLGFSFNIYQDSKRVRRLSRSWAG